MKKVWIGEGIAILLIIIASITAHKLLPDDRALPLRVFSACLCMFIILTVTLTVIIIPSLLQEIKETRRKRKNTVSGIIVIGMVILVSLASSVLFGIRSTRAMKDIINGPVEQPIHKTDLKKQSSRVYKTRVTDYYLYCYTYDEKNEPLKVRVDEVHLDDVETARFVSSYIYGSDDKYMLRYYENLKILVDLQVLKVEPE